jgi:hypothetical protein
MSTASAHAQDPLASKLKTPPFDLCLSLLLNPKNSPGYFIFRIMKKPLNTKNMFENANKLNAREMDSYVPFMEKPFGDEFFFECDDEYSINLNIFGQYRSQEERRREAGQGCGCRRDACTCRGECSEAMRQRNCHGYSGRGEPLSHSSEMGHVSAEDEGVIKPSEVFSVGHEAPREQKDTYEAVPSEKQNFRFQFVTKTEEKRPESPAHESRLGRRPKEKDHIKIETPKAQSRAGLSGAKPFVPEARHPGQHISNGATKLPPSSGVVFNPTPRPSYFDAPPPGHFNAVKRSECPPFRPPALNGLHIPDGRVDLPRGSMGISADSHCPPGFIPRYIGPTGFHSFPPPFPGNPSFPPHMKFYSSPFFPDLRRYYGPYMPYLPMCSGKILLRINGRGLYRSRWIMPSNLSYRPEKDDVLMDFYKTLNEFNRSLNLQFINYRHICKLSILFRELSSLGGFYRAKIKDWNRMAREVPDIVLYKKIYMFLVYPLEQFLLESKFIQVFSDDSVTRSLLPVLSRFDRHDVELCLMRGSVFDILYFLSHFDDRHLAADVVHSIILLFLDVQEVILLRLRNERVSARKVSAKDIVESSRICCWGDKEQKRARVLGLVSRMEEFVKARFKERIMNFPRKSVVSIRNTCLNITSRYVQLCKKMKMESAIGEPLVKEMLDAIYRDEPELQRDGDSYPSAATSIISITGHCRLNCGLTVALNKMLVKTAKTAPILALKCLGNLRLSKNQAKKFFRRLNSKVLPMLAFHQQSLRNRNLLDDDGTIEAYVNAFLRIRTLKKHLELLLLDVLAYCCYLFESRNYAVKSGSSELVEVSRRLMEVVDIHGMGDERWTSLLVRCREIPCFRELLS